MKDQMRLLMGMPDPDSLGGPAACEPPFIAELRNQRLNVEEEIYVYGEKVSRTTLTARTRRVLSTALRIRRKLRSGPFDLLHLNTSFDTKSLLRDVVTLTLLPRQAAGIFMKVHGSDADLLITRNPILRSLVRRLRSRVDGIGVLSTEEKQNFLRAGWNEKKLFVVANIVERHIPSRNGNFNSRYGLPEEVPILLFIARFIPAKGLIDVIRACGLLRDKGINCTLLCVGDGPARRASEAETENLGLKDQVQFLGFISEERTAEFYANGSMLVFPTYHYEGFPMTVFYAAAAGMPIITTRIRGAADYLKEPENCLWVEPRNPAMLAEKIAFLINNPEVRNVMRDSNRQLARRFRAEVVTCEYLQVYREIINRRLAGEGN